RSGQGSYNRGISYYGHSAAILVVLCAWTCLGLAQQKPPQAHPPIAAMMTVPRVVVPDVRGLRLEDAEAALRSAGLVPGRMSSSPGPGTLGTVWHQEPQHNTTVPRGTTFNLMLVALPEKAKSATGENDHNDENFYRTVPKLIGLTPNQASNLLGRSHL